MRIFITGANGFIGSFLTERIIKDTDWSVCALDPADFNLAALKDSVRFTLHMDTMDRSWEWIEEQVRTCDVCLPLAGIARPAVYMKDPMLIFELDFEQNLRIVRMCAEYGKRVIFPSTSEVYGMSSDKELDENTSPLTQGPICKSRWIYSCSKQMMDRVIAALGQSRGLHYTLFRPFNWIGPRQDSVESPGAKQSRVLTQFIFNLMERKPLELVDGGAQRRSFTDIEDGIDALMLMLRKPEASDGRIFNIGNPDNNYSVAELAERTRSIFASFPSQEGARLVPIVSTPSEEYYGAGYQDVQDRRPSIKAATRDLGWKPVRTLNETIRRAVAFYLG